MNEQHQEVQCWLETLFGGEPVPAYELNKRTVSVLYGLMKRSEQNEKGTQLIIADLQQKAEEYSSEANRIEGILKYVNLTSASLSQSGLTSVRTLANVALLLKIKDTTDTSFMLGLQGLDDDLYTLEEAVRKEERNLQHLTEKTKMAILQHNNLARGMQVCSTVFCLCSLKFSY